jgi:hypothetical protein
LVRYYRRFIKGVSKISKPMTELLEMDKKFKWTLACEVSFQELKKRLMTTPILVMLDMEKSFSIYCDASGQGLGCVLMQDGARGDVCVGNLSTASGDRLFGKL